MAQQVGDPEALYLYQLIGAPLLAVIQAEVQAAQASADFIRRVGFEKEPGQPASNDSPASPLQDGGDLGPLRIATFRHTRMGPDGRPQDFNVQVPVLSLFPIPLLQVKTADFDFGVRILSRAPLDSQDRQDRDVITATGKLKPDDFLSPGRVELKGSVTRGGGGSLTSAEMHMKVKVRMEQADLPAGLLALLNIMGQSVASQPATLLPPLPKP